MKTPTVFVSYSHDSSEHADRVLDLSNRLRADGIDCILDQYESSPPEGWPRWMDRNIRSANFVLMICTETYFRRVMGEERQGTGLGVKWEGSLIYQHIYNADTTNTRFIPVLLEGGEVEHIPTPLQGATYYRVDTPNGYEELYRRVTNQPRIKKPELGKLRELAPRVRKPDYLGIRISAAKLPSTHPDLFGRKKELATLDAAWENPRINVLSLVAWGGVGKTALVNKWLTQMAQDNYRGAEGVFGWSFYSQGAAEGRQVSADPFIAAALTWFGDSDPARGSPWDKGVRLSELTKKQRTLLILDGLEPMQNPPPVETGKIKDPGLRSLLRELARHNPGLVIVTSRLTVDDLKDFVGSSAVEIDLEDLSSEAGAEYLTHLGVKGTVDELKRAAGEFGSHALALTLLGGYLTAVHHGDVRQRDKIARLTDENKQGAHARRVMESYERWFDNKPELDILLMMGLFDRPAEAGAIDALRKEPAIKGLTERVQGLAYMEWQYAVENLRAARLLSAPAPDALDNLNCHPLLREHFGEKLQTGNPQAWQEAHRRLYEYYKSAAKEFPDTIEEMAPLYAAVAHGCQAGRHQKVLDEVYHQRISRREKFFNTKKLGVFGADLAALSGFFDPPWLKPVAGLTESAKAFVLNQAGSDLRALGRLAEVVQPLQAALDAEIAQKDWRNAAGVASNLSGLYLTMGDIKPAIDYARQGVELADRSGDAFVRIVNRTALADDLHQAGRLVEAESAFRQAEEMQKKRQPYYPLLYSFEGFRYCDLLLSQGRYRQVQSRAGQTLEWAKAEKLLLEIALDHLSLGRARLLQAQSKGTGNYSQATTYLDLAVDGLRQAGQQEFIILGLLAYAELWRVTNAPDKAMRDLDEAFTTATRGGMRLFEADCHLEYARFYLASDNTGKAREHLAPAKKMIEEMGYHRRDREVNELEKQL